MLEIASPVLELRSVSKIYKMEKQTVPALNNVSVSFFKNQQVVLIGKSGAGKSTLLHLAGLLDRPTTGSMLFNGQATEGLSDKKLSAIRNQHMGFVFQDSYLLPEFSAIENVYMPGLIAGNLKKKELVSRAQELLAALEMDHRMHHRSSELSGGERQRVAIARAIFMAPKILLADEPTGNLDQATSEMIQDLLLQLAMDLEMTLIVVTHDLDLAKKFKFFIEMGDGSILRSNV